MRILFAGSPELAVPSLDALHGRFEVCAVLTNPDRPSGRGVAPVATAVKRRARELGLEVLQPAALDEGFRGQVRRLEPELLVVVAFGRIFPAQVLDLFPRGGVNLHASLLPRHRGPSPISAAILAGDQDTGVTVQRLAPRMDSGDILAARSLPLSGAETTGSLSEALARQGAQLLVETLEAWLQGALQPRPQDERLASYCRLVRKSDGAVDWRRPAEEIERMIRAYDPWPRAYTTFHGRQLNLLAGGVCPNRLPSTSDPEGLVLGVDNQYGILVRAGGGTLYLTRLQLQSKKPLDWRSFLNGQQDLIGAQLGVAL
jgi:methionyl-tRNA formyltransferase